VSFEFVEQEMPAALKFLQLLSLLNPDNISLNFLVEGKSAFETDMQEIVADDLRFAEVLLCLERFSLVKWLKERRTLMIHRLVQAVIKDKMDDRDRMFWASIVIKMCDIVLPKELTVTNETRKLIREYQGQVVTPLVRLGNDCPPEGAEVVYRIGSFMDEEGKYTDAETLISIAIRALSKLPEKDDARILTFSSLLGDIKRKMGQLFEAAVLLQRILDAQKVALGLDNGDTLKSMGRLANVYWLQGLLSEAAELQKETLAGHMRVLGEDHPQTLTSMNSLANVYMDQGLLSEGAELYKETLNGQIRMLGEDHPETLRSMNNLSLTY
jgi:tetratricopeptide (TPR) repeat protein